MAVSTFAELKASVATWIKRSDLTAIIPDFVKLAEARINRELRTRNMVTRAQNTAVDSEFVALPSDFGTARSIRLTASPFTQLQQLTVEAMGDFAAQQPSGALQAFAIVGGEFWFLPAPAASVTVQLVYYAKVPALTDAAPTNWLLASHPDVYLWGALLEAACYLEDDELAATYQTRFAAAVDEIRANSVVDSLSARPTPVAGSGAVV